MNQFRLERGRQSLLCARHCVRMRWEPSTHTHTHKAWFILHSLPGQASLSPGYRQGTGDSGPGSFMQSPMASKCQCRDLNLWPGKRPCLVRGGRAGHAQAGGEGHWEGPRGVGLPLRINNTNKPPSLPPHDKLLNVECV